MVGTKGLRVGTIVKLSRKVLRTRGTQRGQRAKIIGRLTDIEGGVVVRPPLDGCRYWNILDLVRAKPKRGK